MYMTFAVLGHRHLLKVDVALESNLLNVQKSLLSTHAAALLAVRRSISSRVELEQTMFLAGKLTPRMRRLLSDQKKSSIIDASLPVLSQLSKLQGRQPPGVSILVHAVKPRSLKTIKNVAHSQWFPSQTLKQGVGPEVSNEHWVFDVRQQPFGINSKKPPRCVFVRSCFLSVFNELVPQILQAFSDASATASRVLVVSGSPGIGKCWFFVYCVFCFLLDDQVLWYLPPFRLVVTADTDTFEYDRVGGRFAHVENGSRISTR